MRACLCVEDKIKLNSGQITTNRAAVFPPRKEHTCGRLRLLCLSDKAVVRIPIFAACAFSEIPRGIKCIRLDQRKVRLCVITDTDTVKNVRWLSKGIPLAQLTLHQMTKKSLTSEDYQQYCMGQIPYKAKSRLAGQNVFRKLSKHNSSPLVLIPSQILPAHILQRLFMLHFNIILPSSILTLVFKIFQSKFVERINHTFYIYNFFPKNRVFFVR